jgi:hypothetical protein
MLEAHGSSFKVHYFSQKNKHEDLGLSFQFREIPLPDRWDGQHCFWLFFGTWDLFFSIRFDRLAACSLNCKYNRYKIFFFLVKNIFFAQKAIGSMNIRGLV